MYNSLVIEIMYGSKLLASAWYIKGAKTLKALKKLAVIAEESTCSDYHEIDSNREKAIYLLEMTGAGIAHDDEEYAQEHNIRVAENIGEGMIAVSPRLMSRYESWANAVVKVYIDHRKIEFNVFRNMLTDEVPDGIPSISEDKWKYFDGYVDFNDIENITSIVETYRDGVMLGDDRVLRWVS